MAFKRIAVDASKAAFTVHGIDEADRPMVQRDLSRARFEASSAAWSRRCLRSRRAARLTVGAGFYRRMGIGFF